MRRRIIIKESQANRLFENGAPVSYQSEQERIDDEKHELENYLEEHGEYMIDVTNDKLYMVQYLKALSELLGNDYAMCAPVRDDGTYAAFYVKPYRTFKKQATPYFAQNQTITEPTQGQQGVRPFTTISKPNLYQRLRDKNKI